MHVSMAIVATGNGSRYLRNLCQHWSHKFPVDFNVLHGTIDLAAGKCVLLAQESALEVRLEASTEEDAVRLQRVIEEHIKRFAFREMLQFTWRSVAVEDCAQHV